MTRTNRSLVISALLLLLTPVASMASHKPSQAPKEGDMAVSGNLGFANAFDNNFDGLEPVFTGTFEYYSSPRISWRGLLGVTSFDVDDSIANNASIDYQFFNANIVYNWEHGVIHPYVTGGVGIYTKDEKNLPSSFGDSEVGLNGGGGIDWFLGERWGLKFEGTFHGLTGEDPNLFFLGTAGFKWWF
ncbi:MAG TPA: outer membrane beta-barrel protein [Patescibacteria group bacterium]|nr:outer membrane beta-barrel protein [Patescibacteria group bacterium]